MTPVHLADAGFFESGALKFLLEGGPFMWPLLALLVMAIAVIIERYRSLKLLETDAGSLREDVIELLSEDSALIVTPFVRVGTYPTRNFATLGPL